MQILGILGEFWYLFVVPMLELPDQWPTPQIVHSNSSCLTMVCLVSSNNAVVIIG
jgi:hypothetical protein